MAKSTKSGLGRGLNSLLGGSYEEAVPPEPAKPAPRVVIEAEELDEPIKRAFSAPVSAEAPAPPLVPQDKGVSADNFIKDEDHVTIKSVDARINIAESRSATNELQARGNRGARDLYPKRRSTATYSRKAGRFS